MIKVDVVSGFLGAGKTTLIRKLVQAHHSEKLVLIENEFGEIGIDGDLIERDGIEVYEISSGCICCIMQKDFIHLLERVIAEFKPERLIIEPTGISILSEIIEILRKPELATILQINSLITVVDSLNYLEQCDCFGEFFEDQIANAGVLVLSKSQFVESETLERVITSIRELNPDGVLISRPWDALQPGELQFLLDTQADLDFSDILYADYKPCQANEFETLAIKTSRAYRPEELAQILSELGQSRFGQVLRGKGFLKGTQGYLDFSYTNGQYAIEQSRYKTSGKLCLIGRDLKEKEIKTLFGLKQGGVLSWLKF